jgi:20S proteasome alpha/beta subunit
MHRFYDPDMEVSNLIKLAAFMINETATQDPKVGGPLQICTITEREGVRRLTRSEVEETSRRNDEKIRDIKSFFFEARDEQRSS